MNDNQLPDSASLETLTSYIISEQQHVAPHARGHLTILLNAIATGCKFLASAVRKAGLAGVLGIAGSSNVQGEEQKKLDIIANDVFINLLTKSGHCAVLVSEELDEPVFVPAANRGEYCVVFDPLDGSSNIDCGANIGTIFGIYKVAPGSQGTVEDVLQNGRHLVAAGYCMYGSSCVMMLTTGKVVTEFTLDPSLGEFLLTRNSVKVPEKGPYYSVNEGNIRNWNEATKKYVEECKYPGEGQSGKGLRYIGSMVGDVHRTLLYGGIFLYPADKKSPKGKLRLLYECFPMALLMEAAGGLATTGAHPILDLQPDHIHDRSPIVLGSRADVERVVELYKEQGLA